MSSNIRNDYDYSTEPTVTEYYLPREKCARCKMLNCFVCEHNTPVRDVLQTKYAEEGKYYLSATALRKKSTASEFNNSKNNTNNLTAKGTNEPIVYNVKNLSNKDVVKNTNHPNEISNNKTQQSSCCLVM